MSNKTAARIASGRAYAKKNRSHFLSWCKALGFDPAKANRKTFKMYGANLKANGLTVGPKPAKEKQEKEETVVGYSTLPPLKVSVSNTKAPRKEGSKAMGVQRPNVNLMVACPATGFVKLRCGCVRCGNARKSNGKVR